MLKKKPNYAFCINEISCKYKDCTESHKERISHSLIFMVQKKFGYFHQWIGNVMQNHNKSANSQITTINKDCIITSSNKKISSTAECKYDAIAFAKNLSISARRTLRIHCKGSMTLLAYSKCGFCFYQLIKRRLRNAFGPMLKKVP